jgi:hypothetical protein
MTPLLTDRYRDRLAGVLSCYDRIVITGTLPGACFAEGMTKLLRSKGIRIFDYPTFAAGLRDRVREAATSVAAAAGVTIEHIGKSYIRKEMVVAKVLAARGDHPGLVHVISAMEACDAYQPWHDKRTGRTFLRPDSGKCLHYYFYFIDVELGLIYLRVPTPGVAGAGYGAPSACSSIAMAIAGWPASWPLPPSTSRWPTMLSSRSRTGRGRKSWLTTCRPTRCIASSTGYAAQCCPVLDAFPYAYHWSLMQVEYATDLVFRSPATLKPLYEQLARQAVLAVKAEHIATFLGHKITPNLAQEVGSQFTTRIEGTCIKHRYGSSSIKMYDKFTLVLRLETTSNDVSTFKHHRKVEHRNGPATRALAPVKKTIYIITDLREIFLGCNHRYLAFLSALDDFSHGVRALDRLTQPRRVEHKTVKGVNFFNPVEQTVLREVDPEGETAGAAC